nr:DUF202 domain-containing protein [Falsiruegeria litorea]
MATRLALERTRIAYERTAMAWVRTATSFITFGFAIYKFFEIETRGIDVGPRVVGTQEFAIFLIVLGVATMLVGRLEHRRDLRALAKDYPGMPVSGTRLVSIAIGGIGVAAFVSVLLGM